MTEEAKKSYVIEFLSYALTFGTFLAAALLANWIVPITEEAISPLRQFMVWETTFIFVAALTIFFVHKNIILRINATERILAENIPCYEESLKVEGFKIERKGGSDD